MKSLPPHSFDVSVIIPVEFHRGQTVECVRGWTQEQDYAADRYQIILCAPTTIKSETEDKIRSLLRPWDRLEKRPLHHDMPLVAEAAFLAESELLFFTESHCLPEKTALSSLLAVVTEHPEWSGFSCQTTPITHNFLSEIEANVYASHIQHELQSSGGVKVMDQCFLVHRAAYFEAGGFRAPYGHFAEWLLAAEMHRLGLVIGYSSIRVIRHYYSGEVTDLEDFTLDFAIGHIKYLAECGDEAAHAYFPDLPELKEYHQRSQADFNQMAKLKTSVLPAIFINFLKKKKHNEPCASLTLVLSDWLESVIRAFGMRSVRVLAYWKAKLAKHQLLRALRNQEHEQIKEKFIDWFAKLVYLGRMQYLLDKASLQGSFIRNPNYSKAGKLDFRVASQVNSAAEWQGFFDREESPGGMYFRWSKPSASVWLPLHEGSNRVIIEWSETRPIQSTDLLSVNFDSQAVPPHSLKIGANRLIIDVDVEIKGWFRLDWTVAPFAAKGDSRLLGLPITTVYWFSINQSLAREHEAVSARFPLQPVYFLHVPKCAGTSLCLIMENAYHSSAVMSPYLGRYSPDDLEGIESEPPYAYYRGHFRWMLPATLPEQNWDIVTVLRNPVDRIISLFYYFKQHGFINEEKNFMEWFEHDMTFADTMTVHFLPRKNMESCAGGNTVRQTSLALLSDAQANLCKCLAVGVVESIEDSVNILAWHTGFLPPKILPKNNPTLMRESASEIPATLRMRIEKVLEADMILYRHAQKLFQLGMRAMLDTIPSALETTPDTLKVRDWLRRRYINKMSQEGRVLPDPVHIDWTPDDIFHGENLHARELCEGKCLRWTGPNAKTDFYFYLGTPCDWDMTITLHPATPHGHAESAMLSLNGFNIPLQVSYLASDEIKIVAHLTEDMLLHSQDGVSIFSLTTSISQGDGEFRVLGVAIRSIAFNKSTKEQFN